MAKRREIRNSTAEFLIFQAENKEQGIEVMYANETVWCTQKAMAALFDVGVPAISKHLANIFETGELNEEATISKMETVQQEGNREVKRMVVMYSLDAIIAVGYRVNSIRATQFRQWATSVLRQYAIRGYVLDKKRMENGTFLGEDYFEHLLAEIREIRLSERRFYQKLTDIYATSMDYNKDAPTTRLFFKRIQNKMHFCRMPMHLWTRRRIASSCSSIPRWCLWRKRLSVRSVEIRTFSFDTAMSMPMFVPLCGDYTKHLISAIHCLSVNIERCRYNNRKIIICHRHFSSIFLLPLQPNTRKFLPF